MSKFHFKADIMHSNCVRSNESRDDGGMHSNCVSKSIPTVWDQMNQETSLTQTVNFSDFYINISGLFLTPEGAAYNFRIQIATAQTELPISVS